MRAVSLTPADLCHCVWHRAPFSGDGWIFELKHDGFRALARSGMRVQLVSRWGRSMTDQFSEIAAALSRLPDAVLDGELVVPTGEGRSDFEELRRRNLLQRPRVIAESAAHRPAVLVVFDLLQIGDEDLRALPLFARRQRTAPRVSAVLYLQPRVMRSRAIRRIPVRVARIANARRVESNSRGGIGSNGKLRGRTESRR